MHRKLGLRSSSVSFRKLYHVNKLKGRVSHFKSILVSFISISLYSIFVVYSYLNFIYPKFEYMGLQVNTKFSLLVIFLIAGQCGILSVIAPRYLEKPSDLLCALTYLLIYIPTISIGYVSVDSVSYDYLEINALYTVCLILVFKIRNLRIRFFKSISVAKTNYAVWNILIGATFFALILYFYRPNFSGLFSLGDISELYDIRAGYRDSNQSVPTSVQYAFSWMAKFFFPLLLVVGLLQKKSSIAVLSFVGFVALFSTSGHKSIFLSFFAILGFWFLWKKNQRLDFQRIINTVLACVISAVVLNQFFDSAILMDILVRRAIIIPGVLSAFYYDFFSTHDYAFLGYSILSGLVDYSYEASPPFLIGLQYFGRPEMSANANFIAAGYADFGIFGAIFFSALVAFYYRVIDILALRRGFYKGSILLAVVPTWALVDSAFFTVLLTHGLILLLPAIYFLPKNFLSNQISSE